MYVVPDGVVRPQADPLGDGTVLLLRAGKLLLGAEGLLALYNISDTGTSNDHIERETGAYRHLDCLMWLVVMSKGIVVDRKTKPIL